MIFLSFSMGYFSSLLFKKSNPVIAFLNATSNVVLFMYCLLYSSNYEDQPHATPAIISQTK